MNTAEALIGSGRSVWCRSFELKQRGVTTRSLPPRLLPCFLHSLSVSLPNPPAIPHYFLPTIYRLLSPRPNGRAMGSRRDNGAMLVLSGPTVCDLQYSGKRKYGSELPSGRRARLSAPVF